MTKTKKSGLQVTATMVLDVLTDKHFSKGAYEVLREVRNSTGYQNTTRSADALVVSCWPSRGIWFGGVEVKVSRSDWLSELRNPSKSHEIQRFCSYWWIATPEGIVQPAELPETWGHIEVTGSSAKVVKVAPKLEPQPPTAGFLASVMRNRSEVECRLRTEAHRRGYQEASEKFGGATIEMHQRAAELAKLHQEAAEKALQELRERVRKFEQGTGVELDSPNRWHNGSDIERFNALRRAVAAMGFVDLKLVAGNLRDAAARMESVDAEVNAARASVKAPEAGAAE